MYFRQRTFHRQPSAADLDMNWRSRNNAKDQFQPQVKLSIFQQNQQNNRDVFFLCRILVTITGTHRLIAQQEDQVLKVILTEEAATTIM